MYYLIIVIVVPRPSDSIGSLFYKRYCLCLQNCKVEPGFLFEAELVGDSHKTVVFKSVSGLLPVQTPLILPFFSRLGQLVFRLLSALVVICL